MLRLSLKTPFCLLLTLFLFINSASSINTPCEASVTATGELIRSCPDLHSCIDGFCVHKDVFPLSVREIIGSIMLMLLAGFANAGGIGGGALLTPILLLFFNYNANKSIMLVYGIVFGGGLGNFLNVAFQRDPKTDKPFVNYDLSLACMPLMILGAMVGVLLNRISAPILIIIGLIMIIIYTGKIVYTKARTQYAKETSENSASLLKSRSHEEEKDCELSPIKKNKEQEKKVTMYAELREIVEEERKMLPLRKVGIIMLLMLFVVVMYIIRGSKEYGSILGFSYCGVGYWLFFFFTLLGCLAMFFKSTTIVNNDIEVKRKYGYKENDEFLVTPEVVKRLTRSSLLAGVLAGLLGLGGGTVMSPIMLQVGVGPQVLAATAGFFVVQTSFITLFQSLMYGDVTWEELGFFLGVSLVGSYGVSYMLNYLVRKYHRPSLILFTLSFVLLLSLIVMPLFGIYKSIDKPEEMFTFHSLC